MGSVPPSLSHTRASVPSGPFPFHSLSPALPPGSPGTAPWPCLLPSHPKHCPQPPEPKATYLGALLPGEGPQGALTSRIHLGGSCAGAAAVPGAAASPSASLAQRRKPQPLSERGHFSAAETLPGLPTEQPGHAGAPKLPLHPQPWGLQGTQAVGAKGGCHIQPLLSHPAPAVTEHKGIGSKWREIALRRQSPAGKGVMERISGGNTQDLGSDVSFGSILP